MGRNRGKKQREVSNDTDETIKELKAANRRLKSDNTRLKAEIATLHEAFSKTSAYLKGNTDNISVEKIIQGVKDQSTLEEIKQKNRCEKCNSDSIKNLRVPNVGVIVVCTECKHRSVDKDLKDD